VNKSIHKFIHNNIINKSFISLFSTEYRANLVTANILSACVTNHFQFQI